MSFTGLSLSGHRWPLAGRGAICRKSPLFSEPTRAGWRWSVRRGGASITWWQRGPPIQLLTTRRLALPRVGYERSRFLLTGERSHDTAAPGPGKRFPIPAVMPCLLGLTLAVRLPRARESTSPGFGDRASLFSVSCDCQPIFAESNPSFPRAPGEGFRSERSLHA